jgi:hypothetical protein
MILHPDLLTPAAFRAFGRVCADAMAVPPAPAAEPAVRSSGFLAAVHALERADSRVTLAPATMPYLLAVALDAGGRPGRLRAFYVPRAREVVVEAGRWFARPAPLAGAAFPPPMPAGQSFRLATPLVILPRAA